MFAGQGKPDREVVKCTPPPAGAEPRSAAALALTVHAASVAAYRRLEAVGFAPDVLIGHGFGEIAALVAAGAFTALEGAEIVAARCRALARDATGAYSMAIVRAAPPQVAALLSLVAEDGVSLAAENSSCASVIVGPKCVMRAAAELASALDLAVVPLQSIWAPHRRLSDETRGAFASRVRHLAQRPLQTPVFSPGKGRLYRDGDVLIDCLAEQLGEPIRFAGAVTSLVATGVSLIVECGPLRGLGATLDCDSVADVVFCRTLVREVA